MGLYPPPYTQRSSDRGGEGLNFLFNFRELHKKWEDRGEQNIVILKRLCLPVLLIVLFFIIPELSDAQNPNYRPRIHNLNQTAQENLADLISEYTTKHILEQHECMPTMHHAHTPKYIFPWHRAYLENFEDWMHKSNAQSNFLLLPGWDPTEQLPSPFYVLDGSCSEADCPVPQGNCESFIDDHPDISFPDYTSITGLSTLGGFLETYHADVHAAVGGAFGTFRSPAGLMFFPWHAYFDEIWQDWDCNYFSGSQIQDRVDYYIKDTPHTYASDTPKRRLYDAGAEHDQTEFLYDGWISEYIWVRNQSDGFTNQTHQNVRSNQTNYIYVKVRNQGCVASEADEDDIELRWSVSNTKNSDWPNDWNGVNNFPGSSTLPMGGLIGTVTMTQSIDIGKFKVYEYEWSAPDFSPYFQKPLKYSKATMGISILARILSEEDPFKNDLTEETNVYVRDNNNVARRNGLVPSIYFSQSYPSVAVSDPDICCFGMGNFDTITHTSRLYIDVPEDEWADHYFGHGYLFLTLDDSLYSIWTAGGSQGYGITDLGNPIRINAAGAYLDSLVLPSGDLWTVCAYGQVEDNIRGADDRKEFRIDIRQVNELTDSLEGVRLYADLRGHSSESSMISSTEDPINMASGQLQIFPNPTSNDISWILSEHHSSIQWTLFDVNGRIQRSGQGHSGTIPMGDLPKGIFILRAKYNDGSIENHRIIKL